MSGTKPVKIRPAPNTIAPIIVTAFLQQLTAQQRANGPESQHGSSNVCDCRSLPSVIGCKRRDENGCGVDDTGAKQNDQATDQDAVSIDAVDV